tara:strand:- start:226 stop:327 length:102 start_codon:yes stop_codon:yes gene_type:complete
MSLEIDHFIGLGGLGFLIGRIKMAYLKIPKITY